MPYKLTVDIPDGQEVYIHGLGTFGPGTHDISDEEAETFEILNTTNVVNVGTKEPGEDDPVEAEVVHQRGQPLEVAVSSMHGITIEQVQAKDSQPKDSQPKTRTPTSPVDSGAAGPSTAGASEKSGGDN